MISGKTTTGFSFKLSKERLNNYELIEALGDLEDNPLMLAKIVNLILGKEQAKKLKDHVRTEDGLVPSDKLSDEIKDIFESQQETKN